MIFTFFLFFFKSLTETPAFDRVNHAHVDRVMSCDTTGVHLWKESQTQLGGCVAPRLVAKIRSALPYLAQLAKGGSRPTAALEKSMIDTTTAMPQVGDSGLQGDVFHTFHKKTTCILWHDTCDTWQHWLLNSRKIALRHKVVLKSRSLAHAIFWYGQEVCRNTWTSFPQEVGGPQTVLLQDAHQNMILNYGMCST